MQMLQMSRPGEDLPQGDPPVVGGHLAVQEHLETESREARRCPLEEEPVLEAPAREGDVRLAGGLRQMCPSCADPKLYPLGV